MSRKLSRNVWETRSSSSQKRSERGQKCWQRLELGIHGLRSWGRRLSRKVRETRSSGGLQGHEGGTGLPLSSVREAWLASNVPLATVLPLHAPCRRPEIGFVLPFFITVVSAATISPATGH